MANDLLEALVGGGEGFFSGREARAKRQLSIRAQMLRESLARQAAAKQAEEMGFRGKEFGLKERELGLKEREFNEELPIQRMQAEALQGLRLAQEQAQRLGLEDIIPEGVELPLPGGRTARIPGKLDILKEFTPLLREAAQREFQIKYPNLSIRDRDEGDVRPRDIFNARVQLLRDVYGPGVLGEPGEEEPGSRENLYGRMIGAAQKDPALTQYFGAPPPDPVEEYVAELQKQGVRTQDDLNTYLKNLRDTRPRDYRLVEPYLDELMLSFPKGTRKRTPSIPPANIPEARRPPVR